MRSPQYSSLTESLYLLLLDVTCPARIAGSVAVSSPARFVGLSVKVGLEVSAFHLLPPVGFAAFTAGNPLLGALASLVKACLSTDCVCNTAWSLDLASKASNI
jgi:hypothetical protein